MSENRIHELPRPASQLSVSSASSKNLPSPISSRPLLGCVLGLGQNRYRHCRVLVLVQHRGCLWRDGGLRRHPAEHACSTRRRVHACSVLASGTAHRGTELLHHHIGDVHPAPAGCVRHLCPAIVWLRWFRRWQLRFSCSCSSCRRRWCMVSKHCNSAECIRR